mgnify:FL=1
MLSFSSPIRDKMRNLARSMKSNMNGETIMHEGVVTRVGEEEIEVKILSKSACAACHAKGACNLSDMAEKTLVVPRNKDQDFQPMQKVNIKMTMKQAGQAVVLAYVVPFCILVTVLLVLLSQHVDEGLSALISLAALVPYYLILSKCRKHLKKKFRYEVEAM